MTKENNIVCRNRIRKETTKEILNRIDELYDNEVLTDNIGGTDNFYDEIRNIINKEWLYKSDYTN